MVVLLLLLSTLVSAQNNLPRLSPKAYVGQSVGYVNVEINYGTPGVKDRNIWGDLVPYKKVWRTGANEATTIEFDKPLIIEGNQVPAGKYSLFTIPDKDEWIVILNKTYDQWGAYKYNESEDLIRFKVIPKKDNYVERLKFNIEYTDAYKAKVILQWAEISISFLLDSKVSK